VQLRIDKILDGFLDEIAMIFFQLSLSKAFLRTKFLSIHAAVHLTMRA
jgi:hypothetical protein